MMVGGQSTRRTRYKDQSTKFVKLENFCDMESICCRRSRRLPKNHSWLVGGCFPAEQQDADYSVIVPLDVVASWSSQRVL